MLPNIILPIIIILSLFCLILSRIIKRNVKRVKKTQKIQEGKITYSDLNKPSKTFFSKKYLIAGKPDYIVKKDDKYYPVELKTGKNKYPQLNHVLQLAAYCHLLEENFGEFVPYGVLVYNNEQSYKINYNPKIRFELESTIKDMQYTMKTDNIARNHNNKNRCRHCSMRKYCDKKII